MALYAIGDPHLPGGVRNKTMDRFGDVWRDHQRRIAENWGALAAPDDVLLIVGDLSWAMNLDEAADDLRWISDLPGLKVVLRGNHDFWWSGIGRVRAAFGPTVHALQADYVVVGDTAIVGTRGWQCPGSAGSADVMVEQEGAEEGSFAYTAHDLKIYTREVERLRLAFDRLAKGRERYDRLVVALHYPPTNPEHEESGFTELVQEHGVDVCVHGHLHGPSIASAFEGTRGTARYHCVSADAVGMQPRRLLD